MTGGEQADALAGDFSIYTDEEIQGIINAVEEGYQGRETQVDIGSQGRETQEDVGSQGREAQEDVGSQGRVTSEESGNHGENSQEGVAATEKKQETIEDLNYYEGQFELAVEGSTGIVGNKRISFIDERTGSQVNLDRGQTYTILEMSEDEKFFTIQTADGSVGQISTQDTWINLPDIIPSIIYKVSNNNNSLYRSKGHELPGVTGEALYTEKAGYDAYGENAKLGREEFLVPVDFDMAKKIQAVQNTALQDGYSLVIYETFRPLQVQQAVANALRQVDTGGKSLTQFLNEGNNTYYGEGWFIAQGTSNHQYAGAMDCSLAKVNSTSLARSGNYKYDYFTEGDYELLEMPTAMHELSADAAIYTSGVSSGDRNAWRYAVQKDSFANNEYAVRLQKYCTENGLSPLSSEWWHFNDLDSLQKQKGRLSGYDTYSIGQFGLGECVSVADVSQLRESQLQEEHGIEDGTGTGSNIIIDDDIGR